jgi:hypothetical protein
MTTPLQSRFHRNMTSWFIRQRPSEVTIERRNHVADGSGGFIRSPVITLAPQTMRKVASARLSAVTNRTSADGDVVVPTAAMIAMDDADIKRDDRFYLEGRWHRVVSHPLRIPGWRTQADVVEEEA